MTNIQSSAMYEGGCHCGAVRFRVAITSFEAIDCNCSICRKKGFLHLTVPPEQFTLIKGEEALATYRFNTQIAQHYFCRICGIHPFYRSRSHPNHIDVNVRCIENVQISQFKIQPFDGENWEENVAQIRGNFQE
jgi:hypothetical protein